MNDIDLLPLLNLGFGGVGIFLMGMQVWIARAPAVSVRLNTHHPTAIFLEIENRGFRPAKNIKVESTILRNGLPINKNEYISIINQTFGQLSPGECHPTTLCSKGIRLAKLIDCVLEVKVNRKKWTFKLCNYGAFANNDWDTNNIVIRELRNIRKEVENIKQLEKERNKKGE